MINSYTEALMNQGFSEEEATAIYERDFAPSPAAAAPVAPAPAPAPARTYATSMIQTRNPGPRAGYYVQPTLPGQVPNYNDMYVQGYLSSPPPDPRYPRRAPAAPAPAPRAASRPVARRRVAPAPVPAAPAPAPAPVVMMQPNPAPQSVQPRIDYEAMDFLRRGGQPIVEERRDDNGAIAFDRLTEMVDDLDRGDLTAIGDYGVDLTNPGYTPAEFPAVSQADLNGLALRYGAGGSALLTPALMGARAAAPLTGEVIYPTATVRPVPSANGPIIDIQPVPSGYLPGPGGIPYTPPSGYLPGSSALPVASRPLIPGPASGGAAQALPQPTSFMQIQQTPPPAAARATPKPAPKRRGRPRKQRTDNPLPGLERR